MLNGEKKYDRIGKNQNISTDQIPLGISIHLLLNRIEKEKKNLTCLLDRHAILTLILRILRERKKSNRKIKTTELNIF